MSTLGVRIAKLIEAQGPLSVAQFMTMALHDPAAGYYAADDPIGARGDFITAPEISQIFGELIGLWCVQLWREQERPKGARLVELGPGRGTLMSDALRAARLAPDFLDGIEAVLVEASPILREIQRERLRNCGARIIWSERYEPSDRPLFLVANEFFDALPVRQFIRTERGWCERMVVTTDGEKLEFALSPSASLIDADPDAPIGSVIETAPSAIALVDDIARTIANEGGAALIVDYGYTRPMFGASLQAVRKHKFATLLDEPGAIDISAHVDFAALGAAARNAGAEVFGPVEQGVFLERIGLGARAERLARDNPREATAISSAVERLVNPDQMGSLFKVLAILPPNLPPPPGF